MSYRSTNSLGFVGYQFGEALLVHLGYHQADVCYATGASSNMWNGTWTGKHGVHPLEEFETEEAETFAIQEAFGYNLRILKNQLAVYSKSIGTASLLLNETVSADENDASTLQYIEQFGGYDTSSIDTLIAFFDGRAIGDEGLGSLDLPGKQAENDNHETSYLQTTKVDNGSATPKTSSPGAKDDVFNSGDATVRLADA